jgi:hypothetical protein
MSQASSNQSESWDRQEQREQRGSNESTWGEGSASALESLKRREQRRDHTIPRRDQDDHPEAAG